MAQNKVQVTLEVDASQAKKLTSALKKMDKDGKKASGSAKGLSSSFKSAGIAAGVAAAAIAAAAAVMVKMTADLANVIDETNKMSQALGVSTDFWSQLDHVANLAGTSMNDISKGMKKLAKSANDASMGMKKQKDIFRELGVEVKDTNGNFKTMETLTLETMDALAGMTDQTKKIAFAQEVFGRSGNKLIPILNQGSKAIKEQMQDAIDLGVVFGTRAKVAAASFNDQLFRMKQAFIGLRASMSLPLMEQMAAAFQGIAEGVKESAKFFKTAEEDSDALTDTVQFMATSVVFLSSSFQRLSIIGKMTMETLGSSVAVAALTVTDHFTEMGKEMKAVGFAGFAASALALFNPLQMREYMSVMKATSVIYKQLHKGMIDTAQAQALLDEVYKGTNTTMRVMIDAADALDDTYGEFKKKIQASDIAAQDYVATMAAMEKQLAAVDEQTVASLAAINKLRVARSITPQVPGGPTDPAGATEEQNKKAITSLKDRIAAMTALSSMWRDTSVALIQDEFDQRRAVALNAYNDRKANIKLLAEAAGYQEQQLSQLLIEEKLVYEEQVTEIERAAFDQHLELLNERTEADREALEQNLANVTAVTGQIASLASGTHAFRITAIDKEVAKDKARAKATIGNQRALDKRLSQIDAEAEKKKEEAAKKEQRVALLLAIVNTAVGVTKSLNMTPPMNFVMAALTAAAGAVQIATIAGQAFAKGGIVQGQGGTDSELVRATPGEALLTPGQAKALLTGRGGGGTSVSIEGDTIIIQGNADATTVAAIAQTRQDQLIDLREMLIELDTVGQGVPV